MANRVLVKKAEPITKSAGGIILQADKNSQLNWGVVVDVGPGKVDDSGNTVKLNVSVGDHVLLPDWGGSSVTLDGENELHIYRDDDIVGVLSEKVN